MPKNNYQRTLEQELEKISGQGRCPHLLLHSCCAPCSSYVLTYLSRYFRITLLYYNPNISPEAEFRQRLAEQKRLLAEMPLANPVTLISGRYDPAEFYRIAAGHEDDPEGAERCEQCYRLRLEEAARTARRISADYFTTTLSISPLKDAEKLNTIGRELSEQYDVAYLFSDFKKRDGYKESCRLSAEYHLYRQNYCGCIYSKRDAARREEMT